MNKKLTRRDFLKGSAGALAAASLGTLLGCSNQTSSESGDKKSDITWDKETDVVIIGSGTGLFAATFASFKKEKCIVLEKNGIIGGTTITSGSQVYVPCNRWAKEELGHEWTEEEAFAYLKAGDLYNGSTDEMKWDYIKNFHKIMEYMEDEMNYPLMVMKGYGEYDKVNFGQPEGHSIGFKDRETGERVKPSAFMPNYMVPEIEAAGNEILTSTAAKEIIKEDGRVVGVKAEDSNGNSLYIKANKAVILAAGGFDYNEEMCKSYLRGPLFGSMVSPGCTGEGILMGMALGGNLGNMQNTLGGNVFIDEYVPDTFMDHNVAFDFGSYRAAAHTILVNKHGRRFMDEASPYSNYPDAAYHFDTSNHSFTNIPAYLIFTQDVVDTQGWPNRGDSQPEWIKRFDTLDEVAEAYGINAENLKEEVAKFNGYVAANEDPDFTRGTNPWALGMYPSDDGTNKTLGEIYAPYYVGMIAPASLGTKGGLKTNTDAQVIDVFGNVIEGLYAVGTNASAVLGWTYGGGGGGVGPGVFQSFKAINHIFGYHLFD